MPRLKTIYDKEIVAKLLSKLSLKNKHDVQKLKIVLNMVLVRMRLMEKRQSH